MPLAPWELHGRQNHLVVRAHQAVFVSRTTESDYSLIRQYVAGFQATWPINTSPPPVRRAYRSLRARCQSARMRSRW